MKSCRWCDKNFDSDISYQIYCSEQCREEATKEKIAQRYIQSRRQKRKGKNYRDWETDRKSTRLNSSHRL